ncbi:unnamed protein product [Candidula unifasciata]|uniref:DNA polymerase n=1 Tax=Candidula unifasciata TaxID=100452 RepID=A0A8S3ZLG2_9EUPU|nr:unnamed protein product [Candidula unifasciata]
MDSRKRQAESKEGSSKKIKLGVHTQKPCLDKPEEKHTKNIINSEGFLTKVTAYIIPAGIEKTRLEIFKNQIVKNGGHIEERFELNDSITHIIVDDKMEVSRLLRLLCIDVFPKIPVVKSAWLSLCLRKKELVPFEDFQLQNMSTVSVQSKVEATEIKNTEAKDVVLPLHLPVLNDHQLFTKADQVGHMSHMTDSGSDSEHESSDDAISERFCEPINSVSCTTNSVSIATKMRTPKQIPIDKWICAQSSKNPSPNFNQKITEKLEEMVKNYESTNDKWRAFGYQNAIRVLSRHPKEISSWEEAKSLPRVGKRLADKIWEIAQSGELRKLKEFETNEAVSTLKLFTNVWGAGPHAAQMWYQQGFRTISDLKEKASLTHQQQVGVRLYEDLLDRMPREEAGEIERVVKEAAESLQDGIIAQACGSYRRGKPTCGDVDVLITHPDGKSHRGIFHRLLAKLKESGFLTDDLVCVSETDNQKKYMGVCKLPGENRKHRRLDIIVVPYEEYGCALVYFTGSAHFNRSLRHLCKKQNMSLNEHALKTGVVRKGSEKICKGTIIPTPTEESIFQVLKIPFRPPEERDH